MQSQLIRSKFLEYFESRGHKVVASSSLVPAGDPTLLFTNAGMVQFKDVFLGEENRPYNRAVTSQKCVRAGGKHNDLDNVGFTARHLTFFEMLGNFSFGDYFKRDAIAYAQELLTDVFGLPRERLWPTVFHEDDEAFQLWQEVAGYPAERIVRLGEKDNFWAMGDVGPCGPCSEIVLDRGEELACGPQCAIGVCDCDRWLELWNLVFMQYNRDESGQLARLPRPSVDTGMGLERLAAVLQGKATNFDTDLFMPIITALEQLSHRRYGEGAVFPFRVIADHVRSCAFIMADGVLPSNEGRGYVLRRILRRAVRYGRELGITDSFLHRLVPAVVAVMGEAYPEVSRQESLITRAMQSEEERFLETLDTGMRVVLEMVERCRQTQGQQLSGQDAFMLYDTFGFPLDLTRDVARESGLTVDEDAFQHAMEQQRQRARQAQLAGSQSDQLSDSQLRGVQPTPFCGYDALQQETEVLLLLRDGQAVEELPAGSQGMVVLATSPFYALGGGQVADQGTLHWLAGEAQVQRVDNINGRLLHHLKVVEGKLTSKQTVKAVVDAELRWATARHHTATHLLHHALRRVIGEHVRQAGSLVTHERLRFDFTHFAALTADELQQLEAAVNAQIFSDLPIACDWMEREAAERLGAVALFDEKYGQQVRVISSGEDHRELCGGTHVTSSGQIGLCKILSESSVGAGLRRIEAVCGNSLLNYVQRIEEQLEKVAALLGSNPATVAARVEQLLDQNKTIERELEHLREGQRQAELRQLSQQALDLNGLPVLIAQVAVADAAGLRRSGDVAKEQLGECLVVLAAAIEDRVMLLAMASPEAVARGGHCGEIVKAIAPLVGGGGGGRPQMAQAGGRDPGGIALALDRALTLAAAQLGVTVPNREES